MTRALNLALALLLLALSIGISAWLGGEPGETERAYVEGWR